MIRRQFKLLLLFNKSIKLALYYSWAVCPPPPPFYPQDVDFVDKNSKKSPLETAPYHQDWYDLGAAVSNNQGFATYTRNLEVRYWEESFIWTRHNDVRATLFNTINGNSKQFAANHYLCQD